MSTPADRRIFLRHPADIPIDFELAGIVAEHADFLSDISTGGLSFHAARCLPEGAVIRLRIPVTDPAFEASARVVWCRPEGTRFLVGAAFLNADAAFRARMVEQVCAIAQYRLEQQAAGRTLTPGQAALEWIGKFAAQYPQFRP